MSDSKTFPDTASNTNTSANVTVAQPATNFVDLGVNPHRRFQGDSGFLKLEAHLQTLLAFGNLETRSEDWVEDAKASFIWLSTNLRYPIHGDSYKTVMKGFRDRLKTLNKQFGLKNDTANAAGHEDAKAAMEALIEFSSVVKTGLAIKRMEKRVAEASAAAEAHKQAAAVPVEKKVALKDKTNTTKPPAQGKKKTAPTAPEKKKTALPVFKDEDAAPTVSNKENVIPDVDRVASENPQPIVRRGPVKDMSGIEVVKSLRRRSATSFLDYLNKIGLRGDITIGEVRQLLEANIENAAPAATATSPTNPTTEATVPAESPSAPVVKDAAPRRGTKTSEKSFADRIKESKAKVAAESKETAESKKTAASKKAAPYKEAATADKKPAKDAAPVQGSQTAKKSSSTVNGGSQAASHKRKRESKESDGTEETANAKRRRSMFVLTEANEEEYDSEADIRPATESRKRKRSDEEEPVSDVKKLQMIANPFRNPELAQFLKTSQAPRLQPANKDEKKLPPVPHHDTRKRLGGKTKRQALVEAERLHHGRKK